MRPRRAWPMPWLGTDYGFLRVPSPPITWTFLDALAPWPWYLPELALAALAFMALVYAPFFVRDRLAARTTQSRVAVAGRER